MRRRILAITSLAALTGAGVVAALALAPVALAAWDWHSLPDGYSVTSSFTTVCHIATDPCVGGEGSICTHLSVSAGAAGTFTETDCVNPTFQSDLDAYVNRTICTVNPAAGGSACAPATTAQPATTEPPATTTTPPTTTAAPPVTTTAPIDPGPPPTTTAVTTATTTAAPTLEDRIKTLEDQIAALTNRVDRLEKAVDAAWLAYEQEIQKGTDSATAADIARATYLNAVYGLGAFAPGS